jgi:sec-independent protein translocase protein TatC
MSKKDNVDMTFWEHLTELFKQLRKVFVVFIVSTIAVMVVPINLDFTNLNLSNPFYQTITSYVIQHFQERFLPQGITLIPLNFFAPLEVYFFISLVMGAAIGLPVAAYELYNFLQPALRKNEKRFALQFIASFVALFSFGLSLGYMYVVPLTFRTMTLFSQLQNLEQIYNFSEFFSMVGTILLGCGLIFTFPTYVYLLVKANILKTEQLTKNRKYMYGILLIIIAALDPDPTLITEGVTFIPIVILMELTILISKRIEKKRKTTD